MSSNDLPAVSNKGLPGAGPLTRSTIPPYVFLRRFESEKNNHKFSSDIIGKKNPYTEDIVLSESDYYDYLRIHTYFLLCDELVVTQTNEIRDAAQNDITWLTNQNEYLKESLAREEKKRLRLRIVSVVLLILLLASIVTVFALLSSGGTYEDGYAAGKIAGYQSGYAAGKKEGYASGQTDGYHTGKNDGFVDGYQEGYSDGESGVLSWWEQFNKTTAMDDTSSRQSVGGNTGATRDEPIADAYIGNKSSKKFHLPTCSYLPDAANQITFDSRDDAIAAGYSPCGHCHP